MEQIRGFNIGNFYNKKYFTECFKLPTLVRYLLDERGVSEQEIKEIKGKVKESNHRLLSADLPLVISNPFEGSEHYHSFRLKVLYPGLVTGVGLNHEVSLEGEFKLGMHFDYTTGIPIIYGSSVKGVLRSYFIDYCNEIEKGKLLNTIFEGMNIDGLSTVSMNERDVFFDAVIVKGNKDGKILCSDSITPHDENPLRNPIPITFMKIASGCEIEFRFLLKDTKKGDEVIFSAKQKKDLFKQILLEVGIGAKTNVGYGQFEETKA